MNKSLEFTFPIYRLPRGMEYSVENGIDYIETPQGKKLIVDNKSLKGDTLASRRLRIIEDKLEIKKAIFTFAQLLRTHIAKDRYIDSTGYIFSYRKSVWVPLVYRRVIKYKKVDSFGILVIADRVEHPIVLPAGTNLDSYIGLLCYLGGYLLYDIVADKKADTWRKI